jgi:hypothetical protein
VTLRGEWSGSRASRPEADLLRRLLFAAYFFEVGLLLVLVPWSSFWDHNSLLEAVPVVHGFTRSPYVRGAVSGLGLVNLAMGLAELWGGWTGRRRSTSPPFQSVTGSGRW